MSQLTEEEVKGFFREAEGTDSRGATAEELKNAEGEPRVVHVDQELDMKITHLADDFASFVRGLKTEEDFESSDMPAQKRARGADDEEGGRLRSSSGLSTRCELL
ncbi:unnamed protein product [Symbiodinium sp. CCMP2592]|nr:unnamed protein product [Symbiodinium sp. CCMP2592]